MLKTLNQSIMVLNLFTEEHKQWTAHEIASRLNIPQINVYRILETFTSNLYLVKKEETKQYEIGPALALFSYIAYDQYNVATLTQPFLHSLMLETGESVYLVKLDLLEATNIDAFKPENKVSFAVSLNKTFPLYSGASYWAILAHLPDQTIEKILNEPFKALRDPSLLTPEKIQKELEHVRKKGWCVSYELITPDIAAIAAPIFSGSLVIGSVTVAKPIYRTDIEMVPGIGQLVKTTADQISKVLTENKLNFNAYRFFKEKIKSDHT